MKKGERETEMEGNREGREGKRMERGMLSRKCGKEKGKREENKGRGGKESRRRK